MHRLTNNDADRMASDLDKAAVELHALAAWHHRTAAGLEVIGDHRISEAHTRQGEDARDYALQLADYAMRLRERMPLWATNKAPAQVRARLPKSSRRRAA